MINRLNLSNRQDSILPNPQKTKEKAFNLNSKPSESRQIAFCSNNLISENPSENLIITSGTAINGDVTSEKNIQLRVNSMIAGNVKTNGFLKLSPGAKILGDVQAEKFAVLLPGTKIKGELKFSKDCQKVDINGEDVNFVWVGSHCKIDKIVFEDGKGIVVKGLGASVGEIVNGSETEVDSQKEQDILKYLRDSKKQVGELYF